MERKDVVYLSKNEHMIASIEAAKVKGLTIGEYVGGLIIDANKQKKEYIELIKKNSE